MAAVASPRPGVEQIVGFVAAAVGRVGEFAQEAPFLQQTIVHAAGSSSSSSQLLEAGEAAAERIVAAVIDSTGSNAVDDGSSSGTAGSTTAAADALAVEVVLLGVVSSYRRQGVASRLLQQVKRQAMSQG